jgi:RHS repeat-associated protein
LKWKEQDLYGSSRLGMAKPEREMTGFFWASAAYTLVAGAKSYELSNHLGNVMAVISDRGELQSAQDFFPFGMAMPGRSTDAKHRYGFNGKETDPETGLNDFGARLYDSRLGRWLAVDPLFKKYAAFSPYVGIGNNPLIFVDIDGRDIIIKGQNGITYKYGSGQTVPNDKFIQAVVTTLDKLKEKGADKLGIIDKISNNNSVNVSVMETDTWCTRFRNVVGGIEWSPEGGNVNCDDGRRSPAVGLLHEIGHTYYQNYDPDGMTKQIADECKAKYGEGTMEYYNAIEVKQKEQAEKLGYDSFEDHWIIPYVENPASKILGGGERKVHDYKTKYKAPDPFSLEGNTVEQEMKKDPTKPLPCKTECKAENQKSNPSQPATSSPVPKQ